VAASVRKLGPLELPCGKAPEVKVDPVQTEIVTGPRELGLAIQLVSGDESLTDRARDRLAAAWAAPDASGVSPR
jgi:hypothetical protein